jgi:arabinose-5-phosphate isomerase
MTAHDWRPGAAIARGRLVLEVEAQAIAALIDRLDDSFDRAVDLLAGCSGRVVTTGIGKSGIIGQKIAATLSSTGTPAVFMHPAEALHGDLGMLVSGDVVIALSNSGETEEVVRLLPLIRRLGVPLIGLTGNPNSSIARQSDVSIDASIREEACPLGLAPTASTTAALAMGDALAMALVERRGFSAREFAERHPGGALGKRFLTVGELMHRGDKLPLVDAETPLPEVIIEMTSKGFGATTVVGAAGRLVGVITDGDLRRLLLREGRDLRSVVAREAMTPGPHTIDAGALAAAALEVMERHHITSVFVVDEEHRPEGILHIHDLWRLELF